MVTAVAARLFLKLRKTAGLLMVPYIVWVSIAAFLNFRIVQMNRPFA